MSGMELSGQRILIVEDEAVIAMLLEDQLEELGCVVVGAASSVADALAEIEREAIDAVVLDLNLRGEHSYPIAEALTAQGTPYLFITGYGSQGLDPEYQDKPVLQKPFNSSALQQALAGLLGTAASAR